MQSLRPLHRFRRFAVRWLWPRWCWPESRHEKATNDPQGPWTAAQLEAVRDLCRRTPVVVVPEPMTVTPIRSGELVAGDGVYDELLTPGGIASTDLRSPLLSGNGNQRSARSLELLRKVAERFGMTPS